MEIMNEKIKSIFRKFFCTNISESDIENILIDNFHRFALDFQTNVSIKCFHLCLLQIEVHTISKYVVYCLDRFGMHRSSALYLLSTLALPLSNYLNM